MIKIMQTSIAEAATCTWYRHCNEELKLCLTHPDPGVGCEGDCLECAITFESIEARKAFGDLSQEQQSAEIKTGGTMTELGFGRPSVTLVDPGPLKKLGFEAGDSVFSINGHSPRRGELQLLKTAILAGTEVKAYRVVDGQISIVTITV